MQLIGALIVTLMAVSQTKVNVSSLDPGEWSSEARSIIRSPHTESVSINAPNKKTSVTIDGITIMVRQNGKVLPGTENDAVLPLGELAWAPDSKAFFITWSEGGSVGQWLTYVYLVDKERVRRIDVSVNVQKEFITQYKCLEPQAPNTGGIKWIDGSNKLLLVAEVPPHSNCQQMGMLMAYVVAAPGGKIFERLNEAKLNAVWGRYLGSRLKERKK